MTRTNGRWLRCVAAGFLLVMSHPVHAFDAAELQQSLHAAQPSEVRYEETRESPWLAAPVTTRGILKATPDLLEKRVEWPRAEIWRLREDKAEWVGSGGSKQISYEKAPALQILADVSRRAIAGDLHELARDFTIKVSGTADTWMARLQPHTPAVMRLIDSVELQGTGSTLRVLIVVERQGERTTTRLAP
ncbi:LolA-related protein [Ottowia sp.]|jgi:hypothetical protein|uniref:LolA-related protein n=1 Tax=Ottowia sp. TaxID=1898956 RepID=UPI002D073C3B|nr:LolA-related protein [Ottowia sp.]HRN77125.1 hypothetical protein [Ottowia sp.]